MSNKSTEQLLPALLPAESIALTVALSQLNRGDAVPRNTAAMCIMALARITGRQDWTKEAREEREREQIEDSAATDRQSYYP